MRHLVIQQNRIGNSRYGIFGRFTDGTDLSSNRFVNNEEDTKFEDVCDLHGRHGASADDGMPEFVLAGPDRVVVGEPVAYTAFAEVQRGDEIHYR
jgi:hypothetical protein